MCAPPVLNVYNPFYRKIFRQGINTLLSSTLVHFRSFYFCFNSVLVILKSTHYPTNKKTRYLAGLDGSIIILLCLNASSGCVIFY